jgi:hypothetical protein
MKTIVKVILAISFMLPLAAQAAPGDCSVEFGGVAQAIDDAIYLGKRPLMSESSLEVKLESAIAKVSHDKFDDAVEKLEELSDKATGWADPLITRKVKLEDATGINDAVALAIICVASL